MGEEVQYRKDFKAIQFLIIYSISKDGTDIDRNDMKVWDRELEKCLGICGSGMELLGLDKDARSGKVIWMKSVKGMW